MDLSLTGMSRTVDVLKWRFNHSDYYVHFDSRFEEGPERPAPFYYDRSNTKSQVLIRSDLGELAESVAPGHWRVFPHNYKSFRIYFALEKELEDFKLALKLMLGSNHGWC